MFAYVSTLETREGQRTPAPSSSPYLPGNAVDHRTYNLRVVVPPYGENHHSPSPIVTVLQRFLPVAFNVIPIKG